MREGDCKLGSFVLCIIITKPSDLQWAQILFKHAQGLTSLSLFVALRRLLQGSLNLLHAELALQERTLQALVISRNSIAIIDSSFFF